MRPKSVITLLLSLLVTSLSTMTNYSYADENQLIKSYYEQQAAVSVSPHSIRKLMDEHSANKELLPYVLVDLRSAIEYQKEHIKWAVNVPAYSDPDTPNYENTQPICQKFQEIQTEHKGKTIIVYCYSSACMTGKKIGAILAGNGIYVQHLNIGWNEWRCNWTTWNHCHEHDTTKVETYIEKSLQGEP